MQFVIYGIIVIALVILVRNIRISRRRRLMSSPASAHTRPRGASACT